MKFGKKTFQRTRYEYAKTKALNVRTFLWDPADNSFLQYFFLLPKAASADETDEVIIDYAATDGYFEEDGDIKGNIIRTFTPGSTFEVLTPERFTDQLYFEGWYTLPMGKGEKYTEDTVLEEGEYSLYAYWKADLENIEELVFEQEYYLDLEQYNRLYTFTPDETAVYELVTTNAVTEGAQSYLQLLDLDLNEIASGVSIDIEGNSSFSYELTAGVTYIFEISEFTHKPLTLNFRIHRPETAIVTFDANSEEGKTYFDGDPEKTSKEIELMKGRDIHGYTKSGLEVAESVNYTFLGWSKDPDAELPDETLIVEEDMTVYAVYQKLNTIVLDANGGLFNNEYTQRDLNYPDGGVFIVNYQELRYRTNP